VFQVEYDNEACIVGRMSAQPMHFVVVDDNADTRFILVRALSKSFPDTIIQECWDTQTALDRAGAPGVTAAIVHRTTEMTGVYFVQSLRRLNPLVPILMISGIDRSHVALAAGANRFLLFDQWQQVGAVVAELLNVPARAV
jgi:DNA-binding response OmpR family regulator